MYIFLGILLVLQGYFMHESDPSTEEIYFSDEVYEDVSMDEYFPVALIIIGAIYVIVASFQVIAPTGRTHVAHKV